MIQDKQDVPGLLYVKVIEIKPSENEKFGRSKLFIKVGDQTTSLNCDMSESQGDKSKPVYEPKMFECSSDNKFEL